MAELQRAKDKLKRIESEVKTTSDAIKYENELIPFGQPNIEGRRNIYANVQRLYAKQRELSEEYSKQVARVEMLEEAQNFKDSNDLLKDIHVVGKSKYATIGAKTSVNNIDYFKAKLVELEKANEEAKAYNKTKPKVKMATLGSEITKLKRKIAMLEEMKEKDESKVVSERTQKLIEEGYVNQWKKKPIYYFVDGLRKVALEIASDGNFVVSQRYPAYSDEDKAYIEKMLKQ